MTQQNPNKLSYADRLAWINYKMFKTKTKGYSKQRLERMGERPLSIEDATELFFAIGEVQKRDLQLAIQKSAALTDVALQMLVEYVPEAELGEITEKFNDRMRDMGYVITSDEETEDMKEFKENEEKVTDIVEKMEAKQESKEEDEASTADITVLKNGDTKHEYNDGSCRIFRRDGNIEAYDADGNLHRVEKGSNTTQWKSVQMSEEDWDDYMETTPEQEEEIKEQLKNMNKNEGEDPSR